MANINHQEGVYTLAMVDIGHLESDHSLNSQYWPLIIDECFNDVLMLGDMGMENHKVCCVILVL
jgi:hypothetical protein